MKENVIDINDFCIYKGKAYMSNRQFNALIIYNIAKREIESIQGFKHMPRVYALYHEGLIENDGIIYFYPNYCRYIHYYDTEKNKQGYFDIRVQKLFTDFVNMQAVGDKLILFPHSLSTGLREVDIRTGKTVINPQWWKAKNLLDGHDTQSNYFDAGECGNKEVWSHLVHTNQLLITNCYERNVKKYEIYSKGKPCLMDYSNGSFWYSERESGCIFQWSIENGLENRYDVKYPAVNLNALFPYRVIVPVNGHVFVIPYNKNALYMLDKPSSKLEMISQFPDNPISFSGSTCPGINNLHIHKKNINNKLFIFCEFTNLIIQININDLSVDYYYTYTDDSKYAEYKKIADCEIINEWHNIKYENPYVRHHNLCGLISLLCNGENAYNGSTNNGLIQNDVGHRIYDMVKIL